MATTVTTKLSLPEANLNVETLRYAAEKLTADHAALPLGPAKRDAAKRLLKVNELIETLQAS